MSDQKDELIQKKVFYAYKNGVEIHITLVDGKWRNGYVMEIHADFFIVRDRVNGEEPIFFMEVKEVKPAVEWRARG